MQGRLKSLLNCFTSPYDGSWPGIADAPVNELSAAGIDVDVDPETYPNGKFARLSDPDGNPIQLWQPDGADVE